MIGKSLKRFVRRGFGSAGYTIRDVGKGVGGVDLLHDAKVLIGSESNPVLFDVGANIGQTAWAMLGAFRTPIIRSFEPSPSTFTILQKEMANRSSVILEPIALGESVGVMPFHVTQDHSVNDSLLAPTWDAKGTVVEVRVDTVDNYCTTHSIEKIHLLKVDAQGYDLHVLKGARKMLDSKRIQLFCVEANFETMYEGQATLRDLLAYADEVGYRLVGFYEQNYVNNRISYLDALFVSA